MARIASTSRSRRRLSTGRTCRHPTEACAYQVPRVPCLAKMSVSLEVYSARCSSGTAHGAVDELDRDRGELDDVLRGLHGLNETAKVAGANRAGAEQGRKFQLDAGGERERALGADEDMREIELVAAGQERVEVVAT